MSNTNIDVYSLEFWQKVKAEYKPPRLNVFMCMSSPTFNSFWNSTESNRQRIRVLAYQFKKDTSDDCEIGSCFLFLTQYCADIYSMRIRECFIDWCIDKFSKELRE